MSQCAQKVPEGKKACLWKGTDGAEVIQHGLHLAPDLIDGNGSDHPRRGRAQGPSVCLQVKAQLIVIPEIICGTCYTHFCQQLLRCSQKLVGLVKVRSRCCLKLEQCLQHHPTCDHLVHGCIKMHVIIIRADQKALQNRIVELISSCCTCRLLKLQAGQSLEFSRTRA